MPIFLKQWKAGANDFLSKPIREDEFLARIQSAENALRHLQSKTELAELDALTGLLNRRSFKDRGQRLIDRARANSHPLTCIALDVDHFKQFNDQHGHALGDEVLKSVASSIREECRESDILARLGGDEFYILLPTTSEDLALGIAERIRVRIAESPVFSDNGLICIRTTMGVAPLSSETESLDELIDIADRVLIAAKNEGRDRAMCLSDQAQLHARVSTGESVRGIELFRSTPARDVMEATTTLLYQDQAIQTTLGIFLASGADCACVVNKSSELVGMVTERDLLRAMTIGSPDDVVSTIMSSNLARFSPETPMIRIWESLQRNPMLRNIVVDENGTPMGFVRRRALLQLLSKSTG